MEEKRVRSQAGPDQRDLRGAEDRNLCGPVPLRMDAYWGTAASRILDLWWTRPRTVPVWTMGSMFRLLDPFYPFEGGTTPEPVGPGMRTQDGRVPIRLDQGKDQSEPESGSRVDQARNLGLKL